jgi:hypothetical protein
VLWGVFLFLRRWSMANPTCARTRRTLSSSPWCDKNGLICVTAEPYEQGFALYILEPHVHFRADGCRAQWMPDFELANVGSTGIGAFRSPCSGATFDRLGLRLYGPSPRGLDRYPIERDEDGFRVLLKGLELGPTLDASRRYLLLRRHGSLPNPARLSGFRYLAFVLLPIGLRARPRIAHQGAPSCQEPRTFTNCHARARTEGTRRGHPGVSSMSKEDHRRLEALRRWQDPGL